MKKLPAAKKAALLFVLLFLGCCQGNGSAVTIKKSSGEELQVRVEIADTLQEREKGLMFRQSLPEGTGMLFLFPSVGRGSFWMKDTPIPLDMIFIRDGAIVSLIENAVPYSEDILTPDESYTMVLEVPGGTVARHGIQVGDTFEYQPNS